MKFKSKDFYFVYNLEYNCWMHRTPLKYLVNPILRKLQFWTDKPFVIYSDCEKVNGSWHFKRYGFGRVKYLKGAKI